MLRFPPICLMVLFTATGYTWIEMLLAMISKWASQVLFTLLVVHVAECFPTQVRALAVGSSLTMSRIGAIIAPFINRLVSNKDPIVFDNCKIYYYMSHKRLSFSLVLIIQES